MLAALAFAFATQQAAGQNAPFPVHDAKPVITRGPFLIDPSETGVTIVWTTDAPSHSEVRYGTGTMLDKKAESVHHGLIDIGTLHVIRVTGLTPGRTYNYQIASTRVVRMKAYWPEKGLETASPVRTFTTLDRARPQVRFASISDTHESVPRIDSLMRAIDWNATDFLVHTGDAFDWLDNEEQLFVKWLDPVGKGLASTKAMMYARGNHELRGPFARDLPRYVPVDEGRFYYARDHGPVHMLVLDSGEDKPDSTNVYARLNRSEPYLAAQLDWLATHMRTDRRATDAPFRAVLVHQPEWGSMPDGRAKWRNALNAAGIDLVLAGHQHRFSRKGPTDSTQYTTVVVGQGNYANVTATNTALTVVVRSATNAVVDSVTIARRRK